MDSPLAAPIGRVARHAGLLGIALAVTSVMSAGPAFAVIDSPPEPNTPGGVVALLRWCWTHKDATRYRDLFTADYQFIPQAPDIPWNRDDELRAVTALFGPGTADQSGALAISLDFLGDPQPGTAYLPGEPYPQYQQTLAAVALHVNRNDGTSLSASGVTLFHLIRGDAASIPAEMQARGIGPDPNRWYLKQWEDVPAPGTNIDHAPVVVAPPTVTVPAGQPFTMDVTASDLDGDDLSSLSASAPPGASFTSGADHLTGHLTWTPTIADTGRYSVTFTASNRLAGSATTILTVRANRRPTAAVIVSPNTGTAPLLVRVDASGSVDPDGTLQSFRFDFGDGVSGTQAYPITTHTYQRGTWTATVTVTDSDGAVDSAKATVIVAGHNTPPVASLVYSPSTGKIPLVVSFNAGRSVDPDGHIVSYVLDFGDGTSETLSGTTTTHTYGSGRFNATLTVTDNEGATATAGAVIIAHDDRPPVVTAPVTTGVYTRHFLQIQVNAQDPDQDPITSLEAHSIPPGASFVPGTNNSLAFLNWMTTPADTGTYRVTFVARNALADSATTTVTVLPDRRPVVSFAASSFTAHVGHELRFLALAQDPDFDPIMSFTASPLGASTFQTQLSDGAGVYTWTPGTADVGDHAVTFTASNAETGTAQTIIHVLPGGQPPIAALVATPLTGVEPQTVTFDASGSQDPDGQVVRYRFDFGDGPSVTQASPIIFHTFLGGIWVVRVTAIDDLGDEGSATVTVNIWAPTNLARNPSFETDTRYWNSYAGSLLERVEGAGHDGNVGLQITGPSVINGSFGVNDSPDQVRWTTGPGLRYRYSAWVRSPSSHGQAKLRVTEYLIAGGVKLGMATSNPVRLSPDWQQLSVDYTTTAANTTLDFQVRDFPIVPSEVFITDDIAIRNVTPGAGTGMAAWYDGEHDPVAMETRLTPSPMHGSGTLRFMTTVSGPLRVDLVDLAGRRVRGLMSQSDAPAGLYELPITRMGDDGRRLGAGVYFWRVQGREGTKTGRFVMLQ